MKSNQSVESFGSRIDLVIDSLGGPGKAADKIGTTYTSLKRWKANEAEPSLTTLVKISEVANISLDWLMKGEGPVENLKSDQQAQAHTSKVDEDFVLIPAYNIAVSAGHGMFSEGAAKPDKYLAFRRQWVKARNLNPKCLAVLFPEGDSMVPTIPEQAAIVINRERNKALDGKVYVIRIDDRLYVKRTQWMLDGGLRLISDNNVYAALDISKADMEASDVEICGQVIHASHDLPD